jgi:hypothetical protein
MRAGAGVVFLLAATGIAHADEPRYVPAAGAMLTYRTIVTTKSSTGETIVNGQINTYRITSSDGVTAEGTIEPVALITGCTDSNKLYCASAANAPGAHRDGDLLTVPVPDEIAKQLAKQSQLRFHRVIQELRKSASPHLKLADVGDGAAYTSDPLFTTTVLLECDDAALQAFLPFGHQAQATIPCKQSVTQTPGPGTQLKPADISDTISMELSDGGPGEVTVPSGTWEVRKLSFKYTGSDSAHPSSAGEIMFSTTLGVSVKADAVITNPAPRPQATTTIELIVVKP